MHRIMGGCPTTVVGTLVIGLVAGWVLSVPFQVHVDEKRLSGLEWEEPTPGVAGPAAEHAPAGRPLPLRMVDAGGVGIPADTAAWGTTYSHATHAFDHLVLPEAPWLDGDEATKVRADWTAYVGRMADLGNNAVVLDAFLETVNFDRVGDGVDVYPAAAPLRERHLAYRSLYDGLARKAAAVGMDTYLKTDLPVVTPELERYFRERLNGADAADARFWEVYAAAFEELFTTLPRVAGVVIRIGEAGPLFNADGMEYESYMGVRTPEQLQLMLRTLLPVFERHERTLIFRSWSVGLGPLGDMHNDPQAYLDAFGSVDSPSLVISTKFVRGDYFGFLPLNPTLLVGDHRRIIEYQARREYEGFGALPNYLGHAHREALRQVMEANPNLIGTSLWTQEGGPLRAGPLSLYDVTGFWRWTDANVYATSRLAVDPTADPGTLVMEWARTTFDADSATAAGLADILGTSREALEKALYVRPFARSRVEIAGVEVPPILWIFEWDQIGGWNSVLSTLYRTVREDIDTPITEGYDAVRLTRDMKSELLALEPALGRHPDWGDMLRSLDYQASLYGTLAELRAYFLRYHRWLEEGGDAATWRLAAEGFLSAAAEHEATFGGDLDFPAFDFGGAVESTSRSMRADLEKAWARAFLIALAGLLLLGARPFQRRTPAYRGKEVARALRIAASQPHRLADELRRPRRGGWAVAGLVATTVLVTTSLLLAGPVTVGVGVAALALTYMVVLAWSLRVPWRRQTPAVQASAALGPLLPAAALVLSVIAFRGPDYFWFLFWTSDAFRAGLLGAMIALALWALVSSHRIGHRLTGRPSFAAGSVLMASGVMLLVLSGLLPPIEITLAALDEPLQLLPMTRAIINGVTHYGAVSDLALRVPGIMGVALIAGGVGLRHRGAPDVDPSDSARRSRPTSSSEQTE